LQTHAVRGPEHAQLFALCRRDASSLLEPIDLRLSFFTSRKFPRRDGLLVPRRRPIARRTDHDGAPPAIPSAKTTDWTAHAVGPGVQTLRLERDRAPTDRARHERRQVTFGARAGRLVGGHARPHAVVGARRHPRARSILLRIALVTVLRAVRSRCRCGRRSRPRSRAATRGPSGRAARRRERFRLPQPCRGASELVEHLHATRGFAVAAWCGSAECERRIKHDSSATIRCLPLDQPAQLPPCICCGSAALAEAVWAQAY
jgi:hypothetical protein